MGLFVRKENSFIFLVEFWIVNQPGQWKDSKNKK